MKQLKTHHYITAIIHFYCHETDLQVIHVSFLLKNIILKQKITLLSFASAFIFMGILCIHHTFYTEFDIFIIRNFENFHNNENFHYYLHSTFKATNILLKIKKWLDSFLPSHLLSGLCSL